MLQRRHYKIIAEILNKYFVHLENTGDMYFDDLVELFMTELMKDNPRFNGDKFRNAAYGDE
jgi:hypothetical protein